MGKRHKTTKPAVARRRNLFEKTMLYGAFGLAGVGAFFSYWFLGQSSTRPQEPAFSVIQPAEHPGYDNTHHPIVDDITGPRAESVPEALEIESPRLNPILAPQPPAESFDLESMLGHIDSVKYCAWEKLRNSVIGRADIEVLLSLYSDLIEEDPSVEYLVQDVRSYALRNMETSVSFCDGFSDLLLSAFYAHAERHRQGLLPAAVEYVEGILESSNPDSYSAAYQLHSALFRNRYVQGASALARDLGSRAASNGEKAKTSLRNSIEDYDARRCDEINNYQSQISETQSDIELSEADRASRLQVLQRLLDRAATDRDRALYIGSYQSAIEQIDEDLGDICSR